MKTIYFLKSLFIFVAFSLLSCDGSEGMIDSKQMQSDEAFKAGKGSKAKQECAKIQSGTILDDDGKTIQVGFNQTGYNYQAKTYSGEIFPDSSPGWHLKWKWNEAYLSTQDCDGDQRLDIANGQDSYRGTGAWTTTKWTKTYNDKEENECIVSQFTKYVAVPVDATSKNGLFYAADGTEIGQVVDAEGFEDFAKIQLIWNDPCQGINGVDYKAPGPVGLGNR